MKWHDFVEPNIVTGFVGRGILEMLIGTTFLDK